MKPQSLRNLKPTTQPPRGPRRPAITEKRIAGLHALLNRFDELLYTFRDLTPSERRQLHSARCFINDLQVWVRKRTRRPPAGKAGP